MSFIKRVQCILTYFLTPLLSETTNAFAGDESSRIYPIRFISRTKKGNNHSLNLKTEKNNIVHCPVKILKMLMSISKFLYKTVLSLHKIF